MARTSKFVTILAVLTALATLAACGNDTTPSADETSPSPSPSPTATTFTEDELTITTPAGWTREVVTSSVDSKKAVKYAGGDGLYFIVAIDPLGSDFASDETWRYEVSGTSFTVNEKTKCTGGPDQQCSSTDQRYDVYLLAKASETKVGGHTWYFIFGNAKGTSFDAAAFEQIVESIRVTT